jgi:hypothetical protein
MTIEAVKMLQHGQKILIRGQLGRPVPALFLRMNGDRVDVDMPTHLGEPSIDLEQIVESR